MSKQSCCVELRHMESWEAQVCAHSPEQPFCIFNWFSAFGILPLVLCEVKNKLVCKCLRIKKGYSHVEKKCHTIYGTYFSIWEMPFLSYYQISITSNRKVRLHCLLSLKSKKYHGHITTRSHTSQPPKIETPSCVSCVVKEQLPKKWNSCYTSISENFKNKKP